MSVGNCVCGEMSCVMCFGPLYQPKVPIEVPGFRVAISAPLNPKGQVSFEVEIAAIAACIRELSTLDYESRRRALVYLVDRYEERRKL